MLFEGLRVSATLLKFGGLADLLTDYDDVDIENLYRAESLEIIKNDILVELGVNEFDYDALLIKYESLLTEALRHLQRYNISMNLGQSFAEDNAISIIRATELKQYELIKRKFVSFGIKSKLNFAIKSQGL